MLLRPLLTLLASLSLLAVACGDDDDDDDDNAQTEATADESTDEESAGDGDDPCPGEDKAGEGEETVEGDFVTVEYCGTANGELFDSGELDAEIGVTSLIEGFTAALIGMQVGERKTVEIPVDEAYGPPDPALVQTVPEDQLPGAAVGDPINCGSGRGVVTEVGDGEVTVDCNHSLAGQDLTFEIELIEISG